MHDFFRLTSVSQARETLLSAWSPRSQPVEKAPLHKALGRMLGANITSPEHVPPYARSTVDGYAVVSKDTFGASESMPAILTLVEDIAMGAMPSNKIDRGQTSGIPTGGALPPGADACVMVENTSVLDENTILVLSPVSPGENVIHKGEDVRRTELLLQAGHVLRPCDIGALAALGITSVPVLTRVKVAVISTGDEIIDPSETPSPGQIRDINTYSLSSAAESIDARALALGISEDTYPCLKNLVEVGLEQADMVVVSGGSSVGQRDVAVQVISDLGPPGVLVHGIAIKPGKPVILGLCHGKPVFGLPGHPVSALLAFDLFVRFAVESIYGVSHVQPLSKDTWVQARISRSMASFPGRQVSVQVQLRHEQGEVWADPVLGKSGLISTLVRSNGEVTIPADSEGIIQGSQVWVRLSDGHGTLPSFRRILTTEANRQ